MIHICTGMKGDPGGYAYEKAYRSYLMPFG